MGGKGLADHGQSLCGLSEEWGHCCVAQMPVLESVAVTGSRICTSSVSAAVGDALLSPWSPVRC